MTGCSRNARGRDRPPAMLSRAIAASQIRLRRVIFGTTNGARYCSRVNIAVASASPLQL